MIPRRLSPSEAFIQRSAEYVTGLAGKARRALVSTVVGLVFLASIGCSQVREEVFAPEAPVYGPEAAAVLLEAPGHLGSGVIVGMRQMGDKCKTTVVTAAHVATTMELALFGTKPVVIATHPSQDIAVVVYPLAGECSSHRSSVAVIDASGVRALDKVMHVGFPRGQYMIGYATVVNRFPMRVENDAFQDVFSITSIGGPGSSGGAILRDGKLIGLLVRGETGAPFRNYVVPISYIYDLVPELA